MLFRFLACILLAYFGAGIFLPFELADHLHPMFGQKISRLSLKALSDCTLSLSMTNIHCHRDQERIFQAATDLLLEAFDDNPSFGKAETSVLKLAIQRVILFFELLNLFADSAESQQQPPSLFCIPDSVGRQNQRAISCLRPFFVGRQTKFQGYQLCNSST